MKYIPVLSTLVSFVFTYFVFIRFQKKGGKHLLFWAAGLLLYGIGTLCEVWLGFAFSPLVLKIWYLAGAMLTAAWLGQGTVYLLLRKGNTANLLAYALLIVSIFALVLVISAPLITPLPAYDISGTASEQYKHILSRSGLTILLTILLNIYGTIGLVGGAAYSAYLFWRKQVLASRMFGNILIAGGAMFPAMAGTLVKAGFLDALYISELLGAVLMFAGFLLTTSGKE